LIETLLIAYKSARESLVLAEMESRPPAHSPNHHPPSPCTFQPFTKYLDYQNTTYFSYKVGAYSLLAQLLSPECYLLFQNPHIKGCLFLDFDNTLFNFDLISQSQVSQRGPKSHEKFYNGMSFARWFQTLEHLKRQGYLIFIFSHRIPAFAEDDFFQSIVYEDLAPLIDFTFLAGHLAPKGYFLDYFQKYIQRVHGLIFAQEQIVLLDDDPINEASTRKFGFQFIRSGPAAQNETHPFVSHLRSLPEYSTPIKIPIQELSNVKYGAAAILAPKQPEYIYTSESLATRQKMEAEYQAKLQGPLCLPSPYIEDDDEDGPYYPLCFDTLIGFKQIEKKIGDPETLGRKKIITTENQSFDYLKQIQSFQKEEVLNREQARHRENSRQLGFLEMEQTFQREAIGLQEKTSAHALLRQKKLLKEFVEFEPL